MIKTECLLDGEDDVYQRFAGIIDRYWQIDEEAGVFKESVSDLLPFVYQDGGEVVIADSKALRKFVNLYGQAYDQNMTCPECGAAMPVSYRREVKFKPQKSDCLCGDCQKKTSKYLQDRLQEYEKQCQAARVDYHGVPGDIALILIALDRAIKPRLLHGSFKLSDCAMLAPLNPGAYVIRAYKKGALKDIPSLGVKEAYFLRDDVIWHYDAKVAYVLCPDANLGKNEDAFAIFEQSPMEDSHAVRHLWLDYAMDDCLAYLHTQREMHGLGIANQCLEEIKSVLLVALETYSVAELWSVIWRVIRDASSLSTREYYNKEKAAATIPGKIKRLLEKVATGNAAPLTAFSRPHDQPAGTLGDVFYEYFGINEDTHGSTVKSIFAKNWKVAGLEAKLESNPAIEDQACEMVRKAMMFNLEAPALLHFAARIREGESDLEAMESVFKLFPSLAEDVVD